METSQASEAEEAPLHGVVQAGKKFNFTRRPAGASEAQEERQGTPFHRSYEDIRDNAKGAGVEEWRAVDKARSDLAQTYRNLAEDERYAPSYKSEQAWQSFEQVKAQVERLAPEARQKMLDSAESLERMSIPAPEGESIVTRDSTKLLLTAHERTRLEGLLARDKESASKSPFKPKPREILRSEYERGLSEGGPSGGATVRAIVGLARDHGIDIHDLVDERRKDWHLGALQDAQAARMRANMISRNVPEPPFSQATRAATGRYTGKPRVVASRAEKRPLFNKRKRPSWK